MITFRKLQDDHLAMLTRQDASPNDPALVADVQAFINEMVTGSTWIADPGERDLLRAYLRYWAGVVYERTGVFPRTELRPAEVAAPATGTTARPDPQPVAPDLSPAGPARRGPSPLGWLLGGVALLALLIALAVAAGSLMQVLGQGGEAIDSGGPSPSTPLPPTTRTPAPRTPVPSTTIDQRNATQVQALTQTEAHTGGALAVAFDPARPEVATAGADGSARFWTVPDLTLSRQIDEEGGALRAIDYSPYSVAAARTGGAPALFLTGGNGRVVRVYELESLGFFAAYVPANPNSGFVFAARFNPDGRLFASGHGDGVTRIWNVATGTETQNDVNQITTRLAQIPTGGAAVNDVAYRPDGLNLAQALVGVETGLIIVDDTYTNLVCALNTGPALAVAYSPRGDRLAVGAERGSLFLVAADDCQRPVVEAPAHEGGVTDVAFSPSGDWLVTGGRDGTLKIWSADGQWLATLTVGSPVEAVAVDPASGYIASADASGRLILWGIP